MNQHSETCELRTCNGSVKSENGLPITMQIINGNTLSISNWYGQIASFPIKSCPNCGCKLEKES